ncbi:MAG: T9SS type A sorting domain-containing protein [Candidatus Stygibacter frigidus]|nr:T9SS type A sorting domain-containing protein [Candidatus Stygibacter frigidus]
MKKKMCVCIIIIFSVFILFAEINSPILAATTDEDTLLYDQVNGIFREGSNIYLSYYRLTENTDYFNLSLKFLKSDNNGFDFTELGIDEFQINTSATSLFLETKYTPNISLASDGDILIFYTDLVTGLPKVAESSDNGETFITNTIYSLNGGSQFLHIKNSAEFCFASIDNETMFPMSRFDYLTNSEYSENDEYANNDLVKFWGGDVLNGPVHSNDDIWIQQGGGGYNNGWPTFYKLVTTAGRIMDYATSQPAEYSAPMDDIFLGGYIENVGLLNFPSEATSIRENGIILDNSIDRDICYVKINGSTVDFKYADIISERDTFTVYNTFPDAYHMNKPVGDSIWTNYINVKKVVWDEDFSTISVNNASVMVYCQLWIEGDVGSRMTFGCSDTIFITNDLTYQDITPGTPPDEVPGYTNILGLVSEKRIYVQYKNYDPFEEEINSDNCTDIYLYGCFGAIGDGDRDLYGDQNTHYEGIFSFYYQHPHGSTEPFTLPLPNGNEWEVEYPDFHKFIFPPSPYWSGNQGFQLHGNIPPGGFPTCGYPYEDPYYGDGTTPPYGTDWPWYNPVWPEAVNAGMGDRGTIHLYGGIQQYRRGFINRSGTDPSNHQNNDWDISHWLYDGTHGATGYGKDYHYDERMLISSPPDYPCVFNMGGNNFSDSCKVNIFTLNDQTLEITVIDSFILADSNIQLVDACCGNDQYALLLAAVSDSEEQVDILLYNNNNWNLINCSQELHNVQSINFFNENFVIKADHQLYMIDSTGAILPEWNFQMFSDQEDFTNVQGNLLHFITNSNNQLSYQINEIISPDYFSVLGLYTCDFTDFDNLENPDLNIFHKPSGNIVMQILDSIDDEPFSYSSIYLASGDISEFITPVENNSLPEIPELRVYPNPFNPETSINFSIIDNQDVKLDIFNVKGQKVTTLLDSELEAGEHSIIWNAKNYSNGIYYLRLKTGKIVQYRKSVLLK